MEYKLDWVWRLRKETDILSGKYPYYEIRTSSHERSRNYNDDEIALIISVDLHKKTPESIANFLKNLIGQSFIKLKNSGNITHYKSSYIFSY